MSTGGMLRLVQGDRDEGEEGRTVREEFAEHECVVGFGVVFGKSDVLIHVECHDMFESDRWVNRSIFGNSAVTYESFPSFTSEIRCL